MPVEFREVQAAPVRFEQKSPSAQEGGGEITIESLFRTGSVAAMAKGTAVHAWLSQIEWITDAQRENAADEILAATARDWRGIPEEDARRSLGDVLEKLLAPESELGGAFDRGRYARQWKIVPGQVEAWRERSFAVVHGGAIWSGRFDRVVIARNAEGEVVAAEVVDFKTDKEEKPDYYQPQLDSYRTVLEKMFAKQKTRPGITTRLIFTSRRES
jgi:ATP-dependent helicase/nuclease subunit A